ncbi:Zinc finger BED domain-containing protein 4 [Homo sapiens] [Rhizoctonia solani]|uniref:Zinc finger BED domain-containing protein 4 [Homo sapiens] n=1 Tax=Rhizoctonia solani TaxID=456999 RepID=A0A0K6FPV2_9AGAM|nr:Zinc finger BED domain-containing protein 4 [Homo sapiens] [Rhizoctonia solani]
MPQRLWHWDYFVIREEDLPPASRKDYYRGNKPFYNTWCRACLSRKENELEQQDEKAYVEGRISQIRSKPQLRSNAMSSIAPIPSRRERMEAHIRECQLVDPTAKTRLENDRVPESTLAMTGLSLSESTGPHSAAALELTGVKMSPEDQRRFESDLCKLWVALGIPWHGINNPQAHIFFRNWRPDAKLPDRHKLLGSILQHEVESAREAMRMAVDGKTATGMSDGWKNIRRNALLALLLSVDYTTYTLNVHDLSAERKTADNHLKVVLSNIDEAEKKYNIRIIAWVSDAGGESRAMRVRLNRLRPYILVFDCWAHQINLIVGDILKLSSELVDAAEQAIEIIKWLLNHSRLLALFHEEQLRITERTHTLNLPVIFRWSSYFLSFTSLISEARPLLALVMGRPEVFIESAGRASEQVQQVKVIMQNIKDPNFWIKLTELKIYLEPLAIASNVAQAPTTRLDHILIELGRLYYTFSRFTTRPAFMDCVLKSLELRWGKCDQDPFIVAVVLNPYVRSGVFNSQNTLLNRASLYSAAKRVFRRVFRKDNDFEMRDAFMDYLDNRNEFHPNRWDIRDFRAAREQTGQLVNLVELWSSLLAPDELNTGRQQLIHLAINILSIVANSAGCERLFSEMGYTQSKRRSRLSNEKTFDTAVVRMELKRNHAAAGLTRARLRRQFGLPLTKLETVPLPDSKKEDEHDETAEELAEIDTDDELTTNSIRKLAEKLAQDVNDDSDLPDSDDDAGGSLIEPEQQTNMGPRPKRVRLFFGTQYPIPLRDLFNYNAPDLEGQGLNIFKNAGLSNLQKELEAYDLLTRDALSSSMTDELDA